MKMFIRLIVSLVVLSGLFVFFSTAEQRKLMIQWLNVQPEKLVDIVKVSPQINDRKPREGENIKRQVKGRCDRVNSLPVDNRYTVYEWEDLNGRKQISDKRPSSGYAKLRIKNLHVDNFFKLSIDNAQARLPAFTHRHIQTGVKKIYKNLVNVVKVAEVRTTNLKLKFISDERQFHAYRMREASDTSYKTTGFYTDRLNEATIWAVGDRDHMTRIALHESTHAIVAAMFGGTPTWLNEGLASFFEKTVITGKDVYSYSVINEHLNKLRSSRLPSLNEHFLQTHQQWHDDSKSDLNYAVDWSLVFYMMRSTQGRALLRYMLDNLAVNNCHGFDTVEFINQYYPGGLKAFELGWHRWLKTARPNTTMTILGL